MSSSVTAGGLPSVVPSLTPSRRQMQHGVKQHRGVAVGQHEAVAVGPERIVGIEAQELAATACRRGRQRHRRAGMTGIRLCTASIARVRMVSMHRSSIVFWDAALFEPASERVVGCGGRSLRVALGWCRGHPVLLVKIRRFGGSCHSFPPFQLRFIRKFKQGSKS